MTMPFDLPAWLPWWVPLALLLPALLYVLVFLFMPFSVIGVKSRLEAIEARMDELQNEIRHLALRLPAPARETDFEEIYAPRPVERRAPAADPPARPPIPPAAYDLPEDRVPDMSMEPEDRPPPPAHARPLRRSEPPVRPARSEPRVNWPR